MGTDKATGLGASDFKQIIEHGPGFFSVSQGSLQRVFLLGGQGTEFFPFL